MVSHCDNTSSKSRVGVGVGVGNKCCGKKKSSFSRFKKTKKKSVKSGNRFLIQVFMRSTVLQSLVQSVRI
jgi:hypothetical protein